MQEPQGVPLTVLDLFQMIGELYAENWMRKKNDTNKGLQNGTWRMGQDESTPPTGSAVLGPELQP